MASTLPTVASYDFEIAGSASGSLFRTSCDIGILDALLQISRGLLSWQPNNVLSF